MVILALSVSMTTLTFANHQWGRYQWVQNQPLIELKLGDTNGSVCDATTGTVQVCNDDYGNNNWLGIAQIWIVKGKQISKGITKVNDYYFSLPRYNTDDWRQLVMCQEIGHTFGLAHQDENFDNANLGTCMDYTNFPSGNPNVSEDPDNTEPNAHDYDQLLAIYGSEETTDGGCNSPPGKGCNKNMTPPDAFNGVNFSNQGQWGRSIHRSVNGRLETFQLDLGHGHKVITHVIWVTTK